MAAGYSFGKDFTDDDKKTVDMILNKAGIAIEVTEDKLDAVTGLSGSGPAFVARIIQSFIEAGINAGLKMEVSKKLALKTFIGTAKLLENYDSEDLINMVTSPNGTTAAGREILDNSDIKKVINDTIIRAKERSVELGKK
ncbi:MAG: pyrroline-5-carboxylate reductase family protein, partial [Minisyncoccales bacterium]